MGSSRAKLSRVRRVPRLVAAGLVAFATVTPGTVLAVLTTYKNSDAADHVYYSSGTANMKGGYVEVLELPFATAQHQTYKFTPPGFYQFFSDVTGMNRISVSHSTVNSSKVRCRWYWASVDGTTPLFCQRRT